MLQQSYNDTRQKTCGREGGLTGVFRLLRSVARRVLLRIAAKKQRGWRCWANQRRAIIRSWSAITCYECLQLPIHYVRRFWFAQVILFWHGSPIERIR